MDEDKTNHCPNCCNGDTTRERSWQDERTVQGLVGRLNRIEGQVRGIRKMIEKGVYCDDVLNQIASAQAALNGVARLLLEKHIRNCVKNQLAAGDDEVIGELMTTISRLLNRT